MKSVPPTKNLESQFLVLSADYNQHVTSVYCSTQIPTKADFATKCPIKSATLSRTQIMKLRNANHVADFRDLCPRQSTQTFPVHSNELNFIRATHINGLGKLTG